MIDLSAYVKTLNKKPVAVFGLGLSGLSSVRALVAAGADVVAWDDNVEKRDAARAAGAKIDSFESLSGFAFLVLSPGVPLNFPVPHDVVVRARAAGVEIIGDIELLHRAGHAIKTIGVTGTNGKSTTTALIGHILNACHVPAVIGGNIGTPVLDLNLEGVEAIVIELSSYQLDLCPTFSPDIAVHINLTPDHLDRHGSMDGYIQAKMRIFEGSGKAVIGIDDAPSQSMMKRVAARGERDIYTISAVQAVARGAYVVNGMLYDALYEKPAEIGALGNLRALPGVHNHQNIAASYCVLRLMNVREDLIFKSLESFPGLAHRMFTVRIINGVSYINDSKATNADAAGKALVCYKNIYWILGGKPKDGGLNGLEPYIGNVAQGFVIGEAADDFALWLEQHQIPVHRCDTLDGAVRAAHHLAQAARGQPGGAGVVLLSPACASFDQFQSFEQRGRIFTDLVNALSDNQEGSAA